MSQLQENMVGGAWDDPQYTGAILAKGQRKPGKPAASAAMIGRAPLLCSNCHHPIAALAQNACQCSMWDRGKRS